MKAPVINLDIKKTLKFRSEELRQKILGAILSSNLTQQFISKTFAEDSILNSDNRFVIYVGILSKINNYKNKNQATFQSPPLVFWRWLLAFRRLKY